MPEAVTAVIVTWNSAGTVSRCLDALSASAKSGSIECRYIVVDNASTDDSVSIATRSGAESVIENAVNVGFATAVNQGIAHSESAWVFLANPDLSVSRTFLPAMLQAASSAPDDVACLVPDVRFDADPNVINHRGVGVDDVGVPFEIAAGRPAHATQATAEIFGGSGGACLLRREPVVRLGGFEPMYFAYLEDVDLAWRLRRAGFRSLYVPAAVATHLGSSTTGSSSPLRAHLVARNRRLLFARHGPWTPRARAWRAVLEAGHAVTQAVLARDAAPLRGRLEALRLKPHVGYLRACDRDLGLAPPNAVQLAPRVGVRATLARKLASTRHHH